MRISDWSSDVCSSDLFEAPRYRQPFEMDGEIELQQQTEPEGGQGDAGNRQNAHDMIDPAVLVHGRDHAERHADSDAERHGDQHQFYGGGEVAQQLLQDRFGGDDGATEIPMQDAAKIGDVLFGQGSVEAVFVPDDLHHIFGRILAGHQAGRVAGGNVGDDEHDRQQAEQHADQKQQPFADK